MSVEYSVWEGEDGEMVEFEPVYFREHVSTEVKDRAKLHGLVFWNEFADGDPTIVLTDSPDQCGEKLDVFGLQDYLIHRIKSMQSDWESLATQDG